LRHLKDSELVIDNVSICGYNSYMEA